MGDLHDNPLGIRGFEFVEYAAPDADLLHDLFRRLGFTAVARHRDRQVTLYRQGEINFLVNEEPDSFAAKFARMHGPCACGFGIRVADPATAQDFAFSRDAKPITELVDTVAMDLPMIEGIGGSILYLTPRDAGESLYSEFEFFDEEERHPAGFGLTIIDHLTHNVFQGNMDQWAGFYERISCYHLSASFVMYPGPAFVAAPFAASAQQARQDSCEAHPAAFWPGSPSLPGAQGGPPRGRCPPRWG